LNIFRLVFFYGSTRLGTGRLSAGVYSPACLGDGHLGTSPARLGARASLARLGARASKLFIVPIFYFFCICNFNCLIFLFGI